MLNSDFVRNNPEVVRQAARDKQLDPEVVDNWLAADKQWREVLAKTEKMRAQVNSNADKIKAQVHDQKKPDPELVALGKQYKSELKKLEEELTLAQAKYRDLSLHLPNVPAQDVPVGPDESGNQVIRQVGKLPEFDFKPKTHAELMEGLDWLDTKRAVKIGGFRTYMLKNEAVLLEQAILTYALKKLIKEGFTPMSAPSLVKHEAMVGTGYFPWGQQDHYYTQDEQILAGTAEVALTSFHQGEVLSYKDLPIKMAGISPCFRREVGTYGKDTQGVIRVHQFNKVEQVVYTLADEEETRRWHEKMTGLAEELLQDLGLPYQVLLMCTGDMGAGQRKKYDIESWFPGQNKYRETHSASYFNDFQAMRLNIKYKDRDGKTKFVYTLNNTMAASPRILACVIENYQQADGSVVIPEVLRQLVGTDIVKPKNNQKVAK
ncbi:serine--tRNA ligase [bacterium]|nr:serine--tRNA ligase [bacterium]